MTITTFTKNTMLNALAPDAMSLHTGYPGLTGANEVTGGTPAYARKAPTFNSASGGTRITSASIAFDVPACTVRWVGLWNSANFMWAAPNGGSPKEFWLDLTNDLVYAPAHGYVNGDKVTFYADTPPGGLTEGSIYYVVSATTDTFQAATSAGGAAINLTSYAGAACLLSKIVEDVYAAQDTHTIGTATLGLPD